MSIKSRFLNGNLEWYESATAERVLRASPVAFTDDFLGKTFDTTNIWTARDTNGATEAVVADAPNGVLGLTLASTNEIELAGVDWGDQRTLVLNQGLIFESRFRLQTLPTGLVVACVGLCGDFNAAVNTVAESIWFRADGSGAVTVETDDTVHETSLISTGITLTTADWIVAQIDCSDITSVKFYINGNRVASATTFNMSQVAALALQPVARIGKEAAAATVGTLEVDYIRTWQERSA
jgi:hypothetical protein